MSHEKQKKSKNKEIDDQIKRLIRDPLYPNLSDEEKMELSSSGEKSPNGQSPKMPKKSYSPLNTNSMRDISGSPKLRCRICQKNRMNNFENSEDFDSDWETDKLCRCKNFTNTGKKKSIQRERQTPKTEPSASKSSSTYSFLKISILFCTILFICFMCIYWMRCSATSPMNDQLNAPTLVNSLKSRFKNQPSLTYRIINIALKNVLKVQPVAPAIILLLATNGSEAVCSELADSLVDLLSVQDYTVKISGKDFRSEKANYVKKKIDETISNTLKNDQLGSVLVKDLDQIPGKAAVILHKYSDHENAPFKKAVFVLTVNYNKAINDDSNTKVWDKAAYEHLLSIWTDIGVDQAAPLLTRLTVSVAVIKA